MSDTPRTDSQSVKGYETYSTSEYTHKSCAMQLEHELNLATRLLAEKSQALDHWFYESVQPFVDARCKLIEYYGNVQITVGPSGTKVFHTLPAEVQKLDDELAESIEWLRQRFNHPANPTGQETVHKSEA